MGASQLQNQVTQYGFHRPGDLHLCFSVVLYFSKDSSKCSKVLQVKLLLVFVLSHKLYLLTKQVGVTEVQHEKQPSSHAGSLALLMPMHLKRDGLTTLVIMPSSWFCRY